MTRAVEFFHLFFTFEMIRQRVDHTNSYADVHMKGPTSPMPREMGAGKRLALTRSKG